MTTLTAPTKAATRDAAAHAARYVAEADLLGEPTLQIAAWLHADAATLSPASTGYLAATLADRNVRDALLLAASGADDAVVDDVACGRDDQHRDAITDALRRPGTSPRAEAVRAALAVVADRTATVPVLAAEALAVSAALALLARDLDDAARAAFAALDASPEHRLAQMVAAASVALALRSLR